VSELIKDVSFIVRSKKCFEHMFNVLQTPNVTWEATEAALFIMECVARNLDTKEEKTVPKVIEAILNLPESCHVAIRYTSVNILGQLCDWIAVHTQSLEAILNFLLAALQRKAGLASAAAQSLQLICSSCHKEMINHVGGLIEIARCLEMFEVQPEASIALLKGISTTVSRLPNEQITDVMRQLCNFQITHIVMLMENSDKRDPAQWIDRLAAIYRYMNPKVGENEANPASVVISENWPVLSRMLDYYKETEKIIERIVRCIRYGIRCISHQALPILESLVTQMVNVYSSHKHSCLLYLGSILVDEFGLDMRCINGLLNMLEAFIQPTFNVLQAENGLKNNPDTVDDFFRLAVRFIQRMPLHFLQSHIVASIIQCATLACTLDHRDANMSVMKFLSNLLAHGKVNGDPAIRPYVQQIVQIHGETLVGNLLCASIFYLHPNMLSDVVDVFMEIKFINNEAFDDALKKSLTQLPRKTSGGLETATDEQMNQFYINVTK
jgi:transportin-3